jgi:hypothetical protein
MFLLKVVIQEFEFSKPLVVVNPVPINLLLRRYFHLVTEFFSVDKFNYKLQLN